MSTSATANIARVIKSQEAPLVEQWIREQLADAALRGRVNESELRTQSTEFLALLQQAVSSGLDTRGESFQRVRDVLGEISRARGIRGFSPAETASFVFALKRPLFQRLRADLGSDANALADATWAATELLDSLGLYTMEVYQKGREEVISRQQQDLLELSTPVVNLWNGILALPMIGTLDSARTQVVMETLLQRIVETGAEVAIVDITGVPTVDTLTAQHLLKTVTAARLMGAECIISGIRPQIAQTIVHLGIDLADVATKATLADAFRLALEKTGQLSHLVSRSVRG